MLPEHLLLAGIVVLLVLEIAREPRRAARSPLSLLAVTARRGGGRAGLRSPATRPRRFPGSSRSTPADLLAKAVVLALAVPVLLISRDDFAERRFHVLLLSSLYGVCLLLSADSFLTLFLGLELMSLPVYVLVLLAFRRPRERRGGAQVPGARRRRVGDAADGRLAAVRRQRLARVRAFADALARDRRDGARPASCWSSSPSS